MVQMMKLLRKTWKMMPQNLNTNMNQKMNQNMAKKYHQILNMNLTLMLNNLILIQTARDFDVSQILRNIFFAFIKVEGI